MDCLAGHPSTEDFLKKEVIYLFIPGVKAVPAEEEAETLANWATAELCKNPLRRFTALNLSLNAS